MLFLALALLACVLLFLLYRYLPNRRVFGFFCLTLALAAGISYALWPRAEEPPPLTPAQKYDLQQQQDLFAAWYARYQQNIQELDRNWRVYHQILADFRADAISIQTAYVRLRQLEEDEKALAERIAAASPPTELHDNCYNLAAAIQEKTKNYAAAQERAITLTRAASAPENLRSDDQAEQSRALWTVMEKESPVGLFTAGEIAQIQAILAMPGEENANPH